MNCCDKTLDLGCFDSCSTIELPFNYNGDGTFIFLFDTDFTSKHSQVGAENSTIQIDLSILLERAEYSMQILDPTGTKMTYTLDDVVYDCFKFKTYIAKSI